MRQILFAIGALIALAPPACAASNTTGDPKLMSCGSDRVKWAMPADGWPVGNPKFTQSWSCTVSGVTLLVRAKQRNQRTHHCGATAHLYVSAWIDGVKVVDEDDAGDVVSCFGGTALISIGLNKNGSVTVCRQQVGNAEPAGGPPQCETTTPKDWRKKSADPNYALRNNHTLPALVPSVSKADFCASLSPKMQPDDRDEAIQEFALPKSIWQDLHAPEGKFWESWRSTAAIAHLDIDNDEKLDDVFRGEVAKVHGFACCELAWRPAGAAVTPFIARIAEDNGSSDWVAYDSKPLRIDGRSYLYMRQGPAFDWDDFSEIDSGTSPGRVITRAILELHPDGKSTVVCGWTPKPRPEEFL